MGLSQAIGLDIGNTTIKAVEVRAGKAGAQITALGIAPTPVDSVNQSMVIDAAAVAAAVKELLTSCGARARQVISSVAGQQSLVIRIIEVPRMSPKELAETMKWEVERHVPFASSELQMDYQIIERPDTPPEAQTMEVLLVVAQQEMINTHLEVIQGAGLEPAAVDVEPLALARALVDARGPEELRRTIALVNIGDQITDVSIVRDGHLLFQRTIATAGGALTQAIAAALNVNADEADRIKKTLGTVVLDAFTREAGTAGMFGGGPDSALVFGGPPADTSGPAPAPEAPTMFNPFAADAAPAPAAPAPTEPEAPALFNPFGTEAQPPQAPEAPAASSFEAAPAPDAGAAPQFSPFDLSVGEEAAASPSPFALPAAGDAGAGAPASPSPFGAAPQAGGEETFDLAAFAGDDFTTLGGPEVSGVAIEDLTARQVFDIIKEPLTDLVTEIKRSVDYYRGRAGDAAIDVMLLSGGTARLPNLDQLLTEELSLPVSVADPFQAVPVQTTQYPEEYLRQIAPMFAVSVGLGLRETVF